MCIVSWQPSIALCRLSYEYSCIYQHETTVLIAPEHTTHTSGLQCLQYLNVPVCVCMLQVREGWLHWVFNTAPCVKIAMEVLRPEAAAACLQMQRLVRGNFQHKQEGYKAVSSRVWDTLLAWHRWCKKQLEEQLLAKQPE